MFERLALKRPLVILAIIAALSLLAGFLVFGGANMGN
jgi:hypothetical protein